MGEGGWDVRRGRGPARARPRVRARVRAVRVRVLARRAADRYGSDRGSASVWSVGAIAVLCVVFGAVLALGQAVAVRHRAAGGADLAALAAADHWAEGGEAACARAGRLAAAQGTRLVRCAVEGEISDVTAASGSGPFTAEVRARAGPAGPMAPGAPSSDVPPADPAAPAPSIHPFAARDPSIHPSAAHDPAIPRSPPLGP